MNLPHTAKNRKKKSAYIKYVTGVTVLLACVCLVFYWFDRDTSAADAVAMVNDQPLTADEVRMLMERNRGKTFDYFRTEYGADVNVEGFWNRLYGKETPGEYLKEISLQNWVRIKLQQSLAKKEGLIDDISYDGLLMQLETENKRRKNDINDGKVVMGVQDYDSYNYLQTVMTKLQTELMGKLGLRQLKPTESEIKSQYEAMKESDFQKTDIVEFRKIFVPHERVNAREQIEAAAEELRRGNHFEDVSKSYNEEKKVLEDVLNDESLQVYRKAYGPLLDIIPLMKVGEVSEIVEDMGGYYIVECTSREEAGYRQLEEVESLVSKLVVEAKYERYIDDLVRKADVRIIESRYTQLKGE